MGLWNRPWTRRCFCFWHGKLFPPTNLKIMLTSSRFSSHGSSSVTTMSFRLRRCSVLLGVQSSLVLLLPPSVLPGHGLLLFSNLLVSHIVMVYPDHSGMPLEPPSKLSCLRPLRLS
jgi:hypothetical protein